MLLCFSCFLKLGSHQFYTVDGCYGGADYDCEGEEKPTGEEENIEAEVRGCGPGGSTAREEIYLLE